MRTQEFYWLESVLVVGGVALVAFIQADTVEASKASHVTWSWIIHGLFGALYALIGSATTYMAVARQRRRS